MSPTPRLVALILVSGVLVYFSARSMRWWPALCITGLSMIFLLPTRPWSPLGSTMALGAVAELTRASWILVRGPRDAR